MKLKTIVWIFIMGIANQLCAQNGDDEWGAWYFYSGNHRFTERLSVNTDINLNYYELNANLEQLWLITSFNYHIKNNTRVAIGYGYFFTDPTFIDNDGVENFGENRIFEQYTMNHKYGSLKLQHRYRLEHRIFDSDVSKVVTNRFRYRLQLNYPLNNTWFLVANNELFLNFNKNTFNQNRAMIFVGYKLNNQSDFRVGYLKQHSNNTSFDRLLVTYTLNTNWIKKDKIKI